MTIVTVNGESIRQDQGTTLDGLIETLGGGRRGVAVAVNGEVVPRTSWGDIVLVEGDRIEVVAAIAGG